MTDIIQPIIDWYMQNMNYLTIALLMIVESSFIPFPSEVVIPPAAWKAAQGDLDIYLVVLSGTIGALIGALVNYYIAKSLGRYLVYKFADTRLAHFCLIDKTKVEKAEEYFVKHGNVSTFIGRLVPGIRQLISIPAGLSNMKLMNFCLYTTLGALIWNVVLAALGYGFYTQKALLEEYYKELTYCLLGLGVLFIIYLLYSGFKKRR